MPGGGTFFGFLRGSLFYVQLAAGIIVSLGYLVCGVFLGLVLLRRKTERSLPEGASRR